MMAAGPKLTTVTTISCFGYGDPGAAIAWLGKAFEI